MAEDMHADRLPVEEPTTESAGGGEGAGPDPAPDGPVQAPDPVDTLPLEDEDLLDEDREEEQDAEMAAMLASTFEMPEQGSLIQGTVLSITNDDVMVAIGGKSEAVIPLAEFRGESDAKPLKTGETYELVFKGIRNGQPVLSRIEARRRVADSKIKEAFEKGIPVMTKVLRRTKGGLKVEADGLPGFMPFSHSGVRRGQEAEIEALVGQTFPAIIVEPPTEKNMVLSRRIWLEREAEHNRKAALERVQAGRVVTGKVKHLTHFGAFIDLGGIDGLLHVKDMSWGHVAKPEDVVQLGQEIEVVVLSVEGDKIALGLKQKMADPWENFSESHPIGTRCEGAVTSLATYGAFVLLDAGVEGLIHISELSWTRRVRHPSEILKVGDRVQVAVLGFDKDKRRVSLGFKQTTEDPWERILRDHPEGSTITGKVVSMTNYGAFVNLADGVDGMIHVSDIVWGKKINHPSEALREGDLVETKILKIDRENRKISLGMKQVRPDPWSNIGAKYAEGDTVSATVNRLAEFGAFAEIEPGLDGLIHVSEISDRRISHPSEALTVGQKVKATIVKIDPAKRKVGLSIRTYEERGEKGGSARLHEEVPESMSDFGSLLNSALEKDRASRENP
ncbi:MAG: 30S ribosomal protein S1 [bacterium]|nr:30S ribosomal protein S1 [bacterium]